MRNYKTCQHKLIITYCNFQISNISSHVAIKGQQCHCQTNFMQCSNDTNYNISTIKVLNKQTLNKSKFCHILMMKFPSAHKTNGTGTHTQLMPTMITCATLSVDQTYESIQSKNTHNTINCLTYYYSLECNHYGAFKTYISDISFQ